MTQYIDKDALVAELRRRIKSTNNDVKIGAIESLTVSKTLNSLISFLDTLEVKEVDLEKEMDNVWNPHFNLGWDDNSLVSINHKSFESIAKHFFELGLKVNQKGE